MISQGASQRLRDERGGEAPRSADWAASSGRGATAPPPLASPAPRTLLDADDGTERPVSVFTTSGYHQPIRPAAVVIVCGLIGFGIGAFLVLVVAPWLTDRLA